MIFIAPIILAFLSFFIYQIFFVNTQRKELKQQQLTQSSEDVKGKSATTQPVTQKPAHVFFKDIEKIPA